MKFFARVILPTAVALSFALAPVAQAMAAPHHHGHSGHHVRAGHHGHRGHGHVARHFGHNRGHGHKRFYRHGGYAYYNGHRGYRHFHRGYREYNGYWFPPAAFIAGAIIGGILNN